MSGYYIGELYDIVSGRFIGYIAERSSITRKRNAALLQLTNEAHRWQHLAPVPFGAKLVIVPWATASKKPKTLSK